MRWLPRALWPAAAGKPNLSVMFAAFCIFGLSLIFQSHRWHAVVCHEHGTALRGFLPRAWVLARIP
jgi:hypothetical protein